MTWEPGECAVVMPAHIIVGGETMLPRSMYGVLHGDDPDCLRGLRCHISGAANIEVESCRETVARGESKTARVFPATWALDPGAGTPLEALQAAGEAPSNWMPHCIGGSPIAGSPPPSTWVEAVPWHHRKQQVSLSALSRPPCRFQRAIRGLGSWGFAAGGFGCTTHFPCGPAENMHPLLDNSTPSATERRAPPVVRHGRHVMQHSGQWKRHSVKILTPLAKPLP